MRACLDPSGTLLELSRHALRSWINAVRIYNATGQRSSVRFRRKKTEKSWDGGSTMRSLGNMTHCGPHARDTSMCMIENVSL